MRLSIISDQALRRGLVVAFPACAVLLGLPCFADTNTAPSTRAIEAVNRGVSHMGQYQFAPAVEAFQAALLAEPDSATIKINLAIARFNRNRKEERDLESTQSLLEEVLQREPNNFSAIYFKGVVLQHIGKAEGAAPCFERVVQALPEDGAAWYLLGVCRQRLGQSGEPEMLRAVQCRPYLISACYNLYQIALRAGKEEQAKQFLERFTQLRQSALGEAIELPQYDQMGDLALAQPLPSPPRRPSVARQFRVGAPQVLFEWADSPASGSPVDAAVALTADAVGPNGAAAGDLNGDGLVDLVLPVGGNEQSRRLILLLGRPGGAFREATAGSGLEGARGALAGALGDYDNDGKLDLFVACAGGNHLFKGNGDGTFTEVTKQTSTGGGAVVSRFAMFLDADHDGDLDIFVCNAGKLDGSGPAPNQLLRNNGDGTFTEIAQEAGLACDDSLKAYAQAGDINGDRATDLIIFREGKPARVFLNDLFGKFRELKQPGLEIYGERGAVLQDFNGDGQLDLLALGGKEPTLRFFLGDGHGHFQPSEPLAAVTKAAASWGALRGLRVADMDLDGTLDVVVFSDAVHLLFDDGLGKFTPGNWSADILVRQLAPPGVADRNVRAPIVELLDLTGDGVPDLLCFERGRTNRLSLSVGELSSSSTALSILPSGVRSRDGRTRSPATGYGVKLTQRVGLREQTVTATGFWGGPNQSALPVVFGLNGASRADYVKLLWPDGVNQVESGLAAGRAHMLAETQRKISSCPVLFAWNGQRFEFVTDFAGVGGLGYLSAPGVSAPPQVLEHVKIEADQLRPKNGAYELRVAEPMEEAAYIDQLELLAIDHPASVSVFPDERLAINGPPPTHELLLVEHPIFPVKALGPAGEDCTANLLRVDRLYAYEPPLDRRYVGFCRPHALELDFGNRLSVLQPKDRVFLFVHGSIEYPYSQTVYAAGQSRVGWEPIRIDRLEHDGQWKTIVPDGGAPGGTARMMTVDLSGKVKSSTRKLRLTTNLEIYYDQIFIRRPAGVAEVRTQSVPLASAVLRRVGFAREYSPDGRLPLIYDYDQMDATAPFRALRGAYTRYGPVKELLETFDDKYVLLGPGDELALRFEAAAIPATPKGMTRSFVLISHAWCKDMDLYTGAPRTLEPLPFRQMSQYPYSPTEHYPDGEEHQGFLRAYNTRLIK
jgi:tetratricopeptide (TPR) repeat protein